MKLFIAAGILLTICCWGSYGPLLHTGQGYLGGDRLKPLICVGIAYFIFAVLMPAGILSMQGQLVGNWTMPGFSWSVLAGTAGTFGALGIIIALTSGGKPIYVMPMVFGFAPLVNVLVASALAKTSLKEAPPLFYVGIVMVGVGAALVLAKAPRGHRPPPAAAVQPSDAPAASSGGEH